MWDSTLSPLDYLIDPFFRSLFLLLDTLLEIQVLILLVQNLFCQEFIEILYHLQTFDPSYFTILAWFEGESERFFYDFFIIEPQGYFIHLVLELFYNLIQEFFDDSLLISYKDLVNIPSNISFHCEALFDLLFLLLYYCLFLSLRFSLLLLPVAIYHFWKTFNKYAESFMIKIWWVKNGFWELPVARILIHFLLSVLSDFFDLTPILLNQLWVVDAFSWL